MPRAGKVVSVMSMVSRILPASLKKALKRVLYGGGSYCPVCESSIREFLPYGVNPRPEAQCPVCGSLERHRLLWLYFKNEAGLLSPPRKKMLHVAPERCFAEILATCKEVDYLTADIADTSAMVKMDVMDIRYPDNSFDVIYCCHVLEHVPDDRKAMREFARVLRRGGYAVLQVPMDAEKTFEDASVTDPAERERLFGQSDHVRVYGSDYKGRLEEAGFLVTVEPYYEMFDEKTLDRYGMKYEKDDIYLCRLP